MLLNVIYEESDGKVYANIHSATPLPKGMTAPNLVNPTRIVDINSTPFEEIEALPDFVKDKMKRSNEYAARIRHGQNIKEAAFDPKNSLLGRGGLRTGASLRGREVVRNDRGNGGYRFQVLVRLRWPKKIGFIT